MKVDLYIKSVLDKGFFEDILESPFIHSKFKINQRLARNYRDYISKKCHSRYEIWEVFSSDGSEVFFYYRCKQRREYEWTISLYSLGIQYVGTSYHSGGSR